jgi:hypothetical protein
MSIVVRDLARFERHRATAAAVSGLALLLVLVAAVRIVNRLIVDRRLFPSQQILVYDLAGISIRTARNELPGFVQGEQALSLAEIQRIYTPDSISPLYWGDTSTRRLPVYTSIQNENDFSRLAGHWRAVVMRHPREYFAHRSQVARQLLALDRPRTCLPFITGVRANSLGVTFQQNRLNAAVMGSLELVQDSVLFRPGYYLVVGLLMLAALPFIARRYSVNPACVVLLASALMYSLPYYFIAPTCDFRMLWWSIVAVLVAPLTVLDRLFRYSIRNTFKGSRRVTRQAGSAHATRATLHSTTTTATKVTGSCGVISNNRLESTRTSSHALGSPIARPAAASPRP